MAVWGQIMIELREKNPQVAPFLSGVAPQADSTAGDTIVLALEDPFYCQRMRAPQNARDLTALIRDISRAPWKIKVVEAATRTQPDPSDPGAKSAPSKDPASPGKNPNGESSENGSAGIAQSELVEKAKKLFNGRVV